MKLTRTEINRRYIEKLKREKPEQYKKWVQHVRDWEKKNPEKRKEYEKNYRSTEHYKQLRKEQNKRRKERLELNNGKSIQ